MKINWNLMFSIITGITALIAIFQTSCQIKLSNKQHLFDRRINVYSIVNELIESYEQHKAVLEERFDDPDSDVKVKFRLLTNNSYMEYQLGIVELSLEEPTWLTFTKKCEDLRKLASETKLIFSGVEAKHFSEYVSCYEHVLQKMFNYIKALDKMNEINNRKQHYNHPLDRSKDASKMSNEPFFRRAYYKEADKLKQAYSYIKEHNTVMLIAKQIKLK